MYPRRGNAVAVSLLKRIRQNQPHVRGLSKLNDELVASASCMPAALQIRGYNRHHSNIDKNRSGDSKVERSARRRKLATLKDALESVQELVVSLESFDARKSRQKQHASVFQGVKDALVSVVTSVERGVLNPSGKHGKEISKFLELVLYVYSQVHLRDISLFDESQEVLNTLKQWNLDIRSRHYEYAIVLANQEERYKESADLFLRGIDPVAGSNPVNISIANHGLYAIARWAQKEGLPVAEHVFDAVVQLTMVSPSDQERYILAAGTALGHTGEWESASNYLQTSYDASQMGQPLTAGVMQACLLSNRPDAALEAFDYSIDKQAIIGGGEWQWGGGRDKIDALCRDLAMRAMKGKNGMSSLALGFFQQALDEDVCISFEALQGVVEACEHDQNLEGAISVLLKILQDHNKLNWIVDGSELSISERLEPESFQLAGESKWMSHIGQILASVMKTCNSTSNFGIAIFCFQLMHLSTGTENRMLNLKNSGTTQSMESSAVSFLSKGEFCSDLLVAMMVSLCGLRCYQSAVNICRSTTSLATDSAAKGSGLASNDVRSVYEYAQSENMKHGTIRLGNPWMNASKHIQRLVMSVQVIREGGDHASPADLGAVYAALAAAMKACTYVHQSALSLILFSWVKEQLIGPRSEFPAVDKMKISQVAFADDFAMRSDLLFAEVIRAHRWSGNVVGSIDLFESLLGTSSGNMERWTISCNAGLSALIANGQGAAALEIFIALDPAALNQESYITIGNYLAKEKRWADLRDLYSTALEEGYESEELSLSTMEAVVSSKVENRIIVLRTMVDDIAKHTGMKPEDWLRSQYWSIKDSIGFKYARLLMWWNDPDTCHFDELDFAIQEFNERTAAGLNVKYDTIRTILKNARKGVPKEEPGNYRWVPSSSQEWKGLLQAIIEESQSSVMHLDPRMIDAVVMSYLALDCRQECVDFINDMLSKGARVNRKSLVAALDAAHAKAYEDMATDLEMMLAP